MLHPPASYLDSLVLKLLTNSAGGLEWDLPASNGSSGYVLSTDGANPATLSWIATGGSVHAVLYDPSVASPTQIIAPTANIVPLTISGFGSANLFNASLSGSPNGFEIKSDGTLYINTNATGNPLLELVSTVTNPIDLMPMYVNGIQVFDVGPTGQSTALGGFNATGSSGYQYNTAAPTGHYLRGNGTAYVDNTIQASDIPTLTGYVRTAPSTALQNTVTPTVDVPLLTLNNGSPTYSNNLLNLQKNGVQVASFSNKGELILNQGAGAPFDVVGNAWQIDNAGNIGANTASFTPGTDIPILTANNNSATFTSDLMDLQSNSITVFSVGYLGDGQASGNLTALGGVVQTGSPSLTDGIIRFQQSGSSHKGDLSDMVLTANRSWSFPDVSGTIPLVGSGGGLIAAGTGMTITNSGGVTTFSSSGGMTNPMTTLGDIIYENSTPAPDRLPGNTTSTKKFLTQTGTGSISAAPAWGIISAGDIPSLAGSYIVNGTSSQTSANFNITSALAANTAFIENTRTSASASALALQSNQTSSHANYGLTLNVGNSSFANWDVYGTGGVWGVTSAGTMTLGSPLTVPNGGTGLGTLTAHDFIVGNGTSTPNFLAPGTSGNVATSNGTDWVSSAPVSLFTVAQTIEIDNIGRTPTVGLTLQNTTAATSILPQYSPFIDLYGSLYNSASQQADTRIYDSTAIGVTNAFVIQSRTNSGTYGNMFTYQTGAGGNPDLVWLGETSAGTGITLHLNAPGNTCTIDCGASSGAYPSALIVQSGLGSSTRGGGSITFRTQNAGTTTGSNVFDIVPKSVATDATDSVAFTFGDHFFPEIIYTPTTIAAANAGITIPYGSVISINHGTETASFAITIPAGVSGQWLVIMNNTSFATTGTVISAGATQSFVYLNSAWRHIQ